MSENTLQISERHYIHVALLFIHDKMPCESPTQAEVMQFYQFPLEEVEGSTWGLSVSRKTKMYSLFPS